MRRFILLLPLCLVLATLAGCGNKGPLVPAPPKPQPAKASTVAPTPPAAKTAEPAYGSSSAVPASAQS
jgi:predicted small lipoprotein YifL